MGVVPSEALKARFIVLVSPLITLLMVFPNLAITLPSLSNYENHDKLHKYV